MTGKTYDSSDPVGAEVWESVQSWIPSFESAESRCGGDSACEREPLVFFGKELFFHCSRLGQGAFRILVTDAYEKRCAISGERTLPVLQASHIKPYGKGPNRVDNGLF